MVPASAPWQHMGELGCVGVRISENLTVTPSESVCGGAWLLRTDSTTVTFLLSDEVEALVLALEDIVGRRV